MKAYLDSNIIVYIENGDLDINELINRIDNRIQKIFFSTAHIQEADEIQGKTDQERNDRIEKRLETIEKITNGNYLYQDLDHQVYYQIEKPGNVLRYIREVPFANSAMKALANMITEEQRELSRKSLGLEASQLNNYSSSEVIEHLNKRLTNWGKGYSFMDMIELGISYHPQGQSFGLSNRIAGVFELLDFLGYWKDKANEKSNYARIWDSSHTFHAGHCDYFISDDKRARNKAKVVYNIYKIGTKIISSRGEE